MPSIRGETGCVHYCNMEREKKLALENETASTTRHDIKVRVWRSRSSGQEDGLFHADSYKGGQYGGLRLPSAH